jgi:hypothetical protein
MTLGKNSPSTVDGSVVVLVQNLPPVLSCIKTVTEPASYPKRTVSVKSDGSLLGNLDHEDLVTVKVAPDLHTPATLHYAGQVLDQDGNTDPGRLCARSRQAVYQ